MKNLQQISALDFRNNRAQLLWSYLLRLAGLFIFGAFFLWITRLFHPKAQISLISLLNIELEPLPGFTSILLIILDVAFVLYVHELVHASVFYIMHKQPPKIGIKGLVIYAAAPSQMIRRNPMIINALAPFAIISVTGIILIGIINYNYISWVFIPAVINAAASGGDFMAVAWMLQHKKSTVYRDVGDITEAFEPVQNHHSGK